VNEDWALIIPPREAVVETARALLALARDPRDVMTDGNGFEFRVPPYLADLYNAPPAAPKRRVKKEEGDA
jgi:hypothetical protein